MVKLSVWKPGSLPPELLQRGVAFIGRRFHEYWSIMRTEITEDVVANRYNVVAMEDGDVVGWLGTESDGELVNGCVEGSRQGSILLSKMILRMRQELPERQLFAFAPANRQTAVGCLRAGLQVAEPPVTKRLDYPERSIVLIKLNMPAFKRRPAKLSHRVIQRRFRRMASVGSAHHADAGGLRCNQSPVCSPAFAQTSID